MTERVAQQPVAVLAPITKAFGVGATATGRALSRRLSEVTLKRNRPQQKLTDEKQWASWQTHIKRVYRETVHVFRNRLVFREIQNMFRTNPELQAVGGLAYEWILETYGHYIVMAVRREVDRSFDAMNLNQLLSQMIQNPRVVSRRRYLAHFPPTTVIPPEMQNSQFDRLAGSGDHIDIRIVKRDRNKLDKRAHAVVRYANKGVAHRTSDEIQLTINHIDKALDEIEAMLKKYHVILTGAGLVGAEPAIQYNWETAFTIPWIVPKQ